MKEEKEKLIDFFLEMEKLRPYFKKDVYSKYFKKACEEYKEFFNSLASLCEEEEKRGELALVIPSYVHSRIEKEAKKRKKEALTIDFNMTMVTFVIPLFKYTGYGSLKDLCGEMVTLWNEGPVTMQIKESSFEELEESFKSRLCYITTAVCLSQNKADDCYELSLLRKYRDNYLLKSEEGARVVGTYYDVAPTIVNRINKTEGAKKVYQEIYHRYLSPCIRLLEKGEEEECGALYKRMVTDLKREYLRS